MTTFDDVLTWSGTSLYDAGDALKAVANKYEYVYEELTGLSTDGLEGKTAEAEAKARRILADDAMDLWTALGHSGNDLIDSSTTVDSLMNQAWGIKGRVEARELTITNGIVEVPDSYRVRGFADDVHSVLASYQEEVDRLMEQVEDTVVLLQGVYDDIAGLDDTALGPRADVVNAGKQEPDPSWTPDEVNDWWTALSPEEQQDIITNNPWWIGNLNGIPMKDRDAANRVWLPIMQREIDQQVEDFSGPKTNSPGLTAGGNESLLVQSALTPEYAALLQKQKDIHALSAMFNAPSDSTQPGYYSLLVLDNSGDHLRAAVGSGDVDSADHVLVHTPGMTTTVAGGLAGDDGQPGGSLADTRNIVKEAHLNWAQSNNQDSETVAGVTWLGYDAPNWGETLTFSTGTAFNDNEAEKAGPDLAGFYDGVQATHHGDPHLVAGGHSYGSTATGYALRETTAPDDVAIWGSPGATTVDSSDLNMLPDHSYAAAANGDVVAASGVYGGNPTTDPDSDFTALDTDKQDGLGSSSMHSNYTNPGTTSLHDLGNILGGDDPDYVDR